MLDLAKRMTEFVEKKKNILGRRNRMSQVPEASGNPGLTLYLVSSYSSHVSYPQSSSSTRFQVNLLRKYKEAWFIAEDQGSFKADHTVHCSICGSMKSKAESYTFIVLKKNT